MSGESVDRIKPIINDLVEAAQRDEILSKDFFKEKYDICESTMRHLPGQIREILEKRGLTLETVRGKGYILRNLEKDRLNPLNESIADRKTYAENLGELAVEKAYAEDIDKLFLLNMIQKEYGRRDVSKKEIFLLGNKYRRYKGLDPININREACYDPLMDNVLQGLVKHGLLEEKTIKEDSSKKNVDNDLDNKNSKKKKKKRIPLDKRLYSFTKKAPLSVSLTGEEASDLLQKINAFGEGQAFKDTLYNLSEKLSLLLGEEIWTKENINVTGFRLEKKGNIKRIIDELNSLPYEEYALKIRYKGESGKEQNYVFLTGFLCYSVDKDELFLFGEKAGKKKKRRGRNKGDEHNTVILNCERIVSLEADHEIKNTVYSSEYYTDMFNEMFSVSNAAPVHVVVRFDKNDDIEKRLKNLKKIRGEKSSYVPTKDKSYLIYEDDVRGLQDFARYLRKFGSSVKVIEPQALKDIMIRSLVEMKKRYEINE